MDTPTYDPDRLVALRSRLAYLGAKRPRNWKTEARKIIAAILSIEALPREPQEAMNARRPR